MTRVFRSAFISALMFTTICGVAQVGFSLEIESNKKASAPAKKPKSTKTKKSTAPQAVAEEKPARSASALVALCPSDSTMILVSGKPFRILGHHHVESITARESLGWVIHRHLVDPSFQISHLLKRRNFSLDGETVLVAVQAGKDFREGDLECRTSHYQAVNLVVFQNKKFVDNLMNAFMDSAASKYSEDGHEIAVLDTRVEKEHRQIFVARILDDQTIVMANDKALLKDVLTKVKERTSPDAFPKSLPVWQHIDTRLPIWGVRKYAADDTDIGCAEVPAFVEGEEKFRDSTAYGVAFDFDYENSGNLRVTYMTRNEKARQAQVKHWKERTEGLPMGESLDEHHKVLLTQKKNKLQIVKSGSDFITISTNFATHPTTDIERFDIGMTAMTLLQAFGHECWIGG